MNGHRIHLTAIESTNSYTTKLLSHSDIPEWTMVSTDHQIKGKGQRGKSWSDQPGKNLLCSVLLYPKIPVTRQFELSMAVGLALTDLLTDRGMDAKIKWPNDILIGHRKIAGILIENQVKGEVITSSVIGTGLNVNQRSFPEFPWEATSMALESGEEHDLRELSSAYLDFLRQRIQMIRDKPEELYHKFEGKCYGMGMQVQVEHNGDRTDGSMRAIRPDGALVMEVGGEERVYYNGEVRIIRTSS